MAGFIIITGQFVRISQVPAGIGERLLARLVDYAILVAYSLSTMFVIDSTGVLQSFNNVSVIALLVVVYLPVLCYSLLWEISNNGQSPGKRLVNIRVVKCDGTSPSFSNYLLRWLLYSVDVLITAGVGIIAIILTKNNQRFGDLAAGTMVIKEKNYKKIQVSLDEFDYLTQNYRPAFPQAAELSLEQVNVITRTLEMRTADRKKHITQLAAKTREVLSISARQPGVDDESMLSTLIRDYQFYALEVI